MKKCAVEVVLFGRSVMSDSLQFHGLQHTRLPCASPTTGAYSNSCPSSWWCHPTISSSVVPFSYCPQSFPASGSFLMSWHFTSGGQSIGASASALVLPMNSQGWFPLRLTGLILLSKALSRVFSDTSGSSSSCNKQEEMAVVSQMTEFLIRGGLGYGLESGWLRWNAKKKKKKRSLELKKFGEPERQDAFHVAVEELAR